METDAHRVVHQGWGRDFNIIDREGRTIVRAKLSWTARRAAFDVEGKGYIGYFKGWTEAVLEDVNYETIVVARWSVFKPAIVFKYEGHHYELRREGWGHLHYLYRDGYKRVGGFDQRFGFPTKWLIKLSDDLSLAVNVFVLWLVAVNWSRLDASP
jgi:hypothetical protein